MYCIVYSRYIVFLRFHFYTWEAFCDKGCHGESILGLQVGGVFNQKIYCFKHYSVFWGFFVWEDPQIRKPCSNGHCPNNFTTPRQFLTMFSCLWIFPCEFYFCNHTYNRPCWVLWLYVLEYPHPAVHLLAAPLNGVVQRHSDPRVSLCSCLLQGGSHNKK